MRIGILSDSHGRVDTTRQAVSALKLAGAELLLHLGDIETESVLEELVGHNARIVFGNCDYNEHDLRRYAKILGIRVDHPLGVVETDGKRVAFTHGHLPHVMEQAITQRVDYLLHGHTHEMRDMLVQGVRLINPGALFRAARYTAALLDPAEDRLEFLEMPKI